MRDIGVTGVQTCALPISCTTGPRGGSVVHAPSPETRAGTRGRWEPWWWRQAEPGGSEYGCERRYARPADPRRCSRDRKSGGWGKRVDLGGGRIIKKKKEKKVIEFGAIDKTRLKRNPRGLLLITLIDGLLYWLHREVRGLTC